jgi:hypothetical protein
MMPSGTTPNLGLTLPTINGDSNVWGNELNSDLIIIDEAVPSFLAPGLSGFFGPGIFFPPETIDIGTPAVASANQVCICQMLLLARIQPNKVTVNINGSASGGLAAFAVYGVNEQGNGPGSALIASGPLSCEAEGAISAALELTQLLTPGTYYYVWTANNAGILINSFTGYSTAGQAAMFNFNSVRLGTAANPSIGAVLPDELGEITAGALTVPSVYFEV